MSSAMSGEDDAITVPLPTLAALPEFDEHAAADPRERVAGTGPFAPAPRRTGLQTRANTGGGPRPETAERHRAASPFAPRQRRRALKDVVSGKVAAAGAGIAVVISAITLVLNFAGGSGRPVAANTPPEPAQTAPLIADQTRLVVLMSAAFKDAMSCQPGEVNPAGTLASVHCVPRGQRLEAPGQATYRLAGHKDDLDALLKAALNQTTVQRCPGNILSPGPWHLTTNPNGPSGTVFCGTRGDVAVVGWTDADQLTLAEIQSAPMPSPTSSGPALANLYRWWQMNAYRS